MKNIITTFRLGVFIFAMLLVLAAGVFLIGEKQFRFRSTYSVKAEFLSVTGLIPGAPVRVRGIHKGTVKRIDLPGSPDGKVIVVMDLDWATQSVVKKDSVAAIQTEGLLGDKYVEISFGSPGAEKLKDGDSIGSEPPIDISNLIAKTNDILDSTKETVQNAAEATDDLKSVTAKINSGRGTIGALINDKTVYEEASAGATAFRENMDALKQNFLLRGFFKKRGYEDSSDLTRNAIARLPAGPPSKVFAYDAKQLFSKPDNAKLKNEKTLNEVGDFLQEGNFGVAIVAAYAGMKGDTDKQRELTEARTVVVREYLAKNFELDDKKIKTIGMGKTSETDDSGKVEIIVYPPGSKAPEGQKQSPPGRR